ncbi:PocR ligand-binding domain-containing protein [Clostridium saccharobutylicum]|uniref:histidine kinase n=1 Tax=Clostridium saccharobutylicum DSM 13864 TaxID=1345695 RepID=U5MQH4_CLOSA|nr:PocR ligand-binding domain-containing protein [Clostridium saccharobutylicum]AGX42845.1 sensor-like histidine kinase [Clostridium saccharobutylicum DSM 13864]AQR90140.1 sensor histidine kinase TodS [Clostridium saccharobutylicum]AQS00046.1 sensor histidine kinase TodS [Clostridium saccharobutylicum]AQS14029.1 sensor histidine kinase TodS [Clostridium saccharobutylicum]MBA2907791.1 signal transduction histidine kinase [Clostridium saccharobutylicum]
MINDNYNIDIDSIEIKDVIDVNLLQRFQDNFAESLNIASVTVDKNGKPVTTPSSYTSFCMDFVHSTTLGDSRCAECHRKGGEEATRIGRPYIYTCHAGLIDFAAPILINGKQIGTILGGQVLTKEPEHSKYIQIAKAINVNETGFVESVKKIKILTEKNVSSAAEVLFIVANALSKIGYEELNLKRISKSLEIEVQNKNLLLQQSKEYNKLKTQLFSTISHELKTPINIIYSSLQLFENLQKGNSLKNTFKAFSKYSKIMKQNCYRLIRVIDNLIDMNKIEIGFFNMYLKNDDIIKIIEDITLSIVEYANLKNINVVFDTEIEEKITAFDAEKIERIMLNLLSNAIKFTNHGGKINVTVYDKDNYILISVKDTGTGIPQDMLEKIFNTFTQVDNSLRRQAEGSGIGLSLVKSLVEMHKGEITAKSQLGIGSEFLIKLPINLVENESNSDTHKTNHLNYNVENTKIEFSDIYFG